MMTTEQGFSSYQNSQPLDRQDDYDQVDSAEKRHEKKTVNVFGRDFDRDLLVSKSFYFFFFSAFGSLFPLIAVYFKQLGMNATQAGFLVGIRPFIEFASAPFWGQFADKFRKGKFLLLFCLICWIVFTLVIIFVQPGTMYCLEFNETHAYLKDAKYEGRSKRSVTYPDYGVRVKRQNEDYFEKSNFRSAPANVKVQKDHTPGIAPDVVDENKVINYDPEAGDLVSPPYSARVYKESSVQEVFILLMLLVCLGEFFSAPAITLADACTLSYLEGTPELYGKQRMMGSVGWAIAMFVIGVGLDNSNTFHNHPCGLLETHERDYTLCFAGFSLLMFIALIVATQFTFVNEVESQRPDEVPQMVMDSQIKRLDPVVAEQARTAGPEVTEEEVPVGYFGALKTFRAPPYVAFFVVIWWMGFGAGLVFAFLFWHLQDLGGSPTLFGIASVINHVSEIAAYFFSFDLINKIGHIKVLYVGLIANICRFLYISLLREPWFVLPFEFIQGLTHAAVWAAATSYISLAAPITQRASAQGLLQGLHHGLGKGSGALIGGIIITYTGTPIMFAGYAVISLVILGIYFAVNRRFNAESVSYKTGNVEQDGTAALAPHGIPMTVPGQEHITGKFSPQPPGYGIAEPIPDPTQDAYDKYVSQSYEKQQVRFEQLPNYGNR